MKLIKKNKMIPDNEFIDNFDELEILIALNESEINGYNGINTLDNFSLKTDYSKSRICKIINELIEKDLIIKRKTYKKIGKKIVNNTSEYYCNLRISYRFNKYILDKLDKKTLSFLYILFIMSDLGNINKKELYNYFNRKTVDKYIMLLNATDIVRIENRFDTFKIFFIKELIWFLDSVRFEEEWKRIDTDYDNEKFKMWKYNYYFKRYIGDWKYNY